MQTVCRLRHSFMSCLQKSGSGAQSHIGHSHCTQVQLLRPTLTSSMESVLYMFLLPMLQKLKAPLRRVQKAY